MTIQKLLTDYRQQKQAIDLLTKELDEKKVALVEALQKQPGQKAVFDGMSFSLRTTKKYVYSAKVVALDTHIQELTDKFKQAIAPQTEALVELMKAEEKAGTAKLEKETFVPVMTAIKQK